ncbi:hypothetical protein J2S43_000019 [Catenuloplanes nepalensis]|uniref:Methyl-accepting transducer domain-containing protein n=1 Tax=Catenuloplanes nepalensis TaxID=587533 RepID=A0ABT9MJB7_9ACTN|nr:ALF repeat-containing protein [Catenuloplanes nepalensis]MDP9791507.1 hypothetical protein [Catenuloplanes nepalensis]
MVAALTALAICATLLHGGPARADEPAPVADRNTVLKVWRQGGTQVRAAAAAALIGTDAQVSAFLDTGYTEAQKLDERDAVAGAMVHSGPAVRAAAQAALTAGDGGNTGAVPAFLATGWQRQADIDLRVAVNQLMAAGGDQVKSAAQAALDSEDPAVLRAFLDEGWQHPWQTDQRLRINQAMTTGGSNVDAAAQKALDAGTPEALEAFLEYGWAVASARDEETASLAGLLAQAKASGETAALETQRATQEAARAKEASEAAKKAAERAAAATEAARNDTAEAAAQAKRAAEAAQNAANSARIAVQAAAAAQRAARAASAAAARAASAAASAERAAATAYLEAASAASDASRAGQARQAAEYARGQARQAREFAETARWAGAAIEQGLTAVGSAKSAAGHALAAAAANDQAVAAAQAAGADAGAAIAAARRARANAERANRAALAAEAYLRTAMNAAYAAHAAAIRAAQHAEEAAVAAIEAADHAGEAAEAARRATEAAEAATVAAEAAVETAVQAMAIYDAARAADAERIAVAGDDGIEVARTALAEYQAQQAAKDWDAEQAAQRDTETNRLIAEAQNPATPPDTAVASARKAALALTDAPGVWTREAALAALGTSDTVQVLDWARTGIAGAAVLDDRATVMNISMSTETGLAGAALTALAGTDAQVQGFLRDQTYPGRFTQDRLKVNQILAAARTANDVVLAQAAQAALDADTAPALRGFIERGQFTAAAIGERVKVNQILGDQDSGPELKAAAQVALDGPPTALREFLDTGQHTAAERDQEAAAHLAVVGGVLQEIHQVAATAVQNAQQAQAKAAEARNDAEAAAEYAEQAAASAQQAAGYAASAEAYANQALESVRKAEQSVRTARAAATRADASARSAIRSATWAIASHGRAVQAATAANASAKRAYDSAIAAGQDAEAARAAAQDAYAAYQSAQGREIGHCHAEYARGAAPELERMYSGTQGQWYKNCVANVIADPAELAYRAYSNAGVCALYPEGSQIRQNCLASVLDPAFTGMQPLLFLAEMVKGMVAAMAPVGVMAAIGCIATVVCGVVAGTLITLAEVGLNVVKLINGDQGLGETLLKLGQLGLETLIFVGIGKALSAGFKALKTMYVAAASARRAAASLRLADISRIRLNAHAACRAADRGLGLTVHTVAADDPPCLPEIALGKTDDGTDDGIAGFAHDIDAPHYTDWPDDMNWWTRVERALEPDSTVVIHFNLNGCGDNDDEVRAFAAVADDMTSPPSDHYTNWELRMIRDAPESVRPRVIFYRGPPFKRVTNPFGWPQ